MSYSSLFEPLTLASHTMKNRLVLAPTKTGFASAHLNAKEFINFYSERSGDDGVGLVILGNNCIDTTGRLHPFDHSTHEDEWVHATALTSTLHEQGTKVIAQLVHHGNDVRHYLNFSSSHTFNPDTQMSGYRLPGFVTNHFINKYVAHAYHAVKNGLFDGVEIYGGHRSLPNGFASSALNHRGDKWGLKSGFLFHSRLIRRLRNILGPEPIITYRLSLLELIPDGSDWESVCRLTKLLYKLGVNIFSFEIGLSENLAPINCELTPPGVWFDYMRQFALENNVPVIFGKRLPEPDSINEYLSSTPNSLVEIGRPLIADADWVKKVKNDALDTITPCVECPQRCLSSYLGGRPQIHCVANPRLTKIPVQNVKPANPKPLVIIGGGPAGMAAAHQARQLGRDVTLVEEREELGGLYRLAASIPGRDTVLELLEKQEQNLVDAGVTIIKEKKATYDWLMQEYPAADYLLATGTQSRIPDIPGIDSPNVFTFEDLLSSTWSRRRHIAIIGTSSLALDLARFFCSKKSHNQEEWLNAWGINNPKEHRGGVLGVIPELYTSYRSIYLILTSSFSELETSLTNSKRYYELDWLRMNGVRTFSNVTIEHIDNNHIRMIQRSTDDKSDKIQTYPTVIPEGFEIPDELIVVIAEGLEPRTELIEALSEHDIPFTSVGSVKQENRLWGASLAAYDGYMTALKIG